MSTDNKIQAVWNYQEMCARNGNRESIALIDLHARLTALEAAQSTTTPHPQPAPPAVGVTVEVLEGILYRGGAESLLSCARLAAVLLAHPRLGPLLRGEGRRWGELPEEPPAVKAMAAAWAGCSPEAIVRHTWTAARAELARQQGGQG